MLLTFTSDVLNKIFILSHWFSLYAVFKVHKDASDWKNSSALKACFHKQVCFCRHWHVMPWAIRPKVLELRICSDWHSSVITYTNLFVYLITGETSFHSTALLIGLARRIVVHPCQYLFLTSAADLPLPFSFKFGGHLLSHTVSSAVPSAVWVLTIVFGMGTGVTPRRIATKKAWVLSEVFSSLELSLFTALGEVLSNLARWTLLFWCSCLNLITQQ